jgi:hypothetical protein
MKLSILKKWFTSRAPLEEGKSIEAGSLHGAGSECLPVTRRESDRIHHYFPRADAVGIDIYNDGEVVVLVRVGEKTYIQECGGGTQNS